MNEIDPMILDMLIWVLALVCVGALGWIMVAVKDEFDPPNDNNWPGGTA